MWGKKKEVKREPLGYIGDMSDHQQEVFNKFKEWIITNNITENPWHNDPFFLKFCRARKFDLQKIQEMFTNYMNYRRENDLDNIATSFIFDKKEQIAQYYPRGYCGIDKLGRPIYIENSGMIQPTKIWEICDEDYLWRSYYQTYEVLLKKIFMSCSLLKGQQIAHTLIIQDLKGFSIGMMNKKVYSLVQHASKISQDYYPEQLGQLIIVNAPMLFTGVYAMIKGWIDEKTRQKITFEGSGFREKLLSFIDEDQLYITLGGKKNGNLHDDDGPWNDFEIVDGYKKDDVVGIRRISDGPSGQIFTPKDFENLPNYMIEQI